jgi:hypothetical protein
MNKRLHLALVLALIMVLGIAVTAETRATVPDKEELELAGLKSPAQLTAFVTGLRKAVKSSDKAAVADMVEYPVEIQAGKSLTIENRAAFIRNFDTIITKAVRKAVLEEPFINKRGVIQLTGSGSQIWLMVSDGKLRIITIITD